MIFLCPFAIVQGQQGTATQQTKDSDKTKFTIKEKCYNEDELNSQLGWQNVGEERREVECQSNETNKTKQGLYSFLVKTQTKTSVFSKKDV